MHTHSENQEHVAAGEFDWNEIYSGDRADYEAPDPDVVEIAADLSPGRALDIGCGAGGLLLSLAESGWEVTGVDIAERAIASARSLLDHHGAAAELIAADASRWEPTGTYDLITSSFALPDRPQRTEVLRMMGAALAPGGTIIVKEFDPGMARHGFFSGFDLPSVEELTEAFADLEIERAQVVDTPVHDHAGHGTTDSGGWSAALLVARRPRALGGTV